MENVSNINVEKNKISRKDKAISNSNEANYKMRIVEEVIIVVLGIFFAILIHHLSS